MIDNGKAISDLEHGICWIEADPAHHFPGWINVVMAMREALEVLKMISTPETLNSTSLEVPDRDCFSCANSFVDSDDKLHCMAEGHNHEKIVEDDFSCEDWNR